MSDANGSVNGGVDVGWKSVHLRVWGQQVILVLLVMFTVAMTWFAHRELIVSTSREHAALKHASDINGCINTYDFAERKVFREQWRKGMTWSAFCPWMDEDPTQLK